MYVSKFEFWPGRTYFGKNITDAETGIDSMVFKISYPEEIKKKKCELWSGWANLEIYEMRSQF